MIDIQEMTSIEDKYYPNFINFNEMSFDSDQQMVQNNNSPPQTIEGLFK